MDRPPIGVPVSNEPSPAMAKRSFQTHNNITGGGLLLYLFLFLGIQTCYQVIEIFKLTMKDPGITSPDRREEYMETVNKLAMNGVVFIISIVIGIAALCIYFRKRLPVHDLFVSEQKMTGKTFINIFFIFFAGQAVGQILGVVIEKLLNLMGMSNAETAKALEGIFGSPTMILYATILGPIAEELVFRGFLMRRFQAWGKLFAIVMTALLFGLFHMNLVQTPYCILIGLVFGYIAMEYGIQWSIIMHIINNGALAFGMEMLSKAIGEEKSNYIFLAFLGVCLIAGIIILIANRRKMAEYISSNRTERPRYFWAILTPTILIVILLTLAMILLTLLLSMAANLG